MTICSGCSSNFPRMDHSLCSKCTKKLNTPGGDFTAIDEENQCDACGCTYPFMTGDYCNSCVKALNPASEKKKIHNPEQDTRQQAQSVMELAETHQKDNTKHRIGHNDRAKSLAKSHAALKEKSTALRKGLQREFGVEFNAFYWPLKSKAKNAIKIPIPTLHESFPVDSPVTDVFDVLIRIARTEISTKVKNAAKFSYERSQANFTVQTTGNVFFNVDSELQQGTLEALVSDFKSKNMLLEKVEKQHRLTMHVEFYEKADSIEITSLDSQEGLEGSGITSDSDTDYIIKGSRKRRGRSAPASTPPRKRRIRIPPVPATRKASSGKYKSAYRPSSGGQRLSTVREEINYESIAFIRYDCLTDDSGDISLTPRKQSETILVAKGWQKYKTGDKQQGGYIAKGWSKYAFAGQYENEDVAIFQCNPDACNLSYQNEKDLTNELKVMTLGSYFLKMFEDRLDSNNVFGNYMGLGWNTPCFLGRVAKTMPVEGFANPNGSLIYQHFLVAPLLPVRNRLYTERKFSGSEQIGRNVDFIGGLVDAFVHSAFVDSFGHVLFSDVQGLVAPNGTVTLFDPQAHTKEMWSGYWDKGKLQMEAFMREHECNEACHDAGLDPFAKNATVEELWETVPSDDLDIDSAGPQEPTSPSRPLRHGFPSP